VPALLTGLLGLALVTQTLVMNREPELPPAIAVGAARLSFRSPVLRPVTVPPVIFVRPLFAPRQSPGNSLNAGPPPILGGGVVAGTVTIRGRSYAVVRRSTGAVVNLPVGGTISGWRLTTLGPQGAVFEKGRERRTVPYGTQPAAGELAEPSEQ
jgi:hypothetical protein